MRGGPRGAAGREWRPTPPELEKGMGMRIIRRALPYLWPKGQFWAKWRVVAALAVLVLAKLVAVTTPLFYKGAVDQLSDSGTSTLLLGAIGMTVAYGGARVMSNGFQQLRDALFAKVSQRALRQLAGQTFRHIHSLSLSYHISRKTGGLSRIIERGVKGIEFLLRFLLFSIGPLMLELIMISVMLYIMLDGSYLAVIVITTALYVTFTFRITEWRVRLRRQMNRQDTEANQRAVDSLLNFETVKYFGAEEREAARYDRAMEGYEKAAIKTAYSLGLLNFGQVLLLNSGLVFVMVMAARGVESGELTVGDFVMVNAYMMQITMPLGFLGSVYREIRQSLVDMGEMFELLDQPPEVLDRPNAGILKVAGGAVRFEQVRFTYDPQREVLKGVDFDLPAGGKLAIVGASGGGKTTIGRLLFRFYDVTGGAIKIDGQDVRDITQSSLHDAIGIVPQDTVLFNDTVFYNIAYGKDGATREEVEAAVRSARLHDFIMSLPDGYDTTVGERGLKLSGGEKQRVGIARTLLKDPPILLLDEATSALDSETERGIQGALARAGEGRSVITIAHRLSTISGADMILVLEDGVIVESGNHEVLLARNGRYRDLWDIQAADKDAEPD